jgi:tetratricopeptide (TPR) repeat protein
LERGAIPEALAYAETAYASAPRHRAAIGQLAGMLARVGQTERSEGLISQLRPGEAYGAPFGLTLCYLAAGDIDQAADWLEKAIDQRDVWVPHLLMAGNMGGRVIWSSPRWPKLAKLLNVPVTRNWTW